MPTSLLAEALLACLLQRLGERYRDATMIDSGKAPGAQCLPRPRRSVGPRGRIKIAALKADALDASRRAFWPHPSTGGIADSAV